MSIVYYQEASEAFMLATSMQAIAVDPNLWAAYIRCTGKGRDVFKECASDPLVEWSIDTVIAWAEAVENPQPEALPTPPPSTPVRQPPPPRAAARGPAIRARGRDEDGNSGKFIAWMKEHTALVGAGADLGYACGPRVELATKPGKARTISVSVTFTRGGRPVGGRGLSFVFHYHPGVTGAAVGSTEGSKWHFKPYDGAKTHVRLPDHNFAALNPAMVKRVKDIARGR